MSQLSLKNNPRITAKDRGIIKGALRRAFSRSQLYIDTMAKGNIQHASDKNPRCRNWSWCEACGEVLPRWKLCLDHIEPVVPLDKTFEDMTLDEVVNRLWCDPSGLQRICDRDHDVKTKAERALRPKKPRKTKKNT